MTRDTVRKDRGGRIAQGRKSDRIKEVGPFQEKHRRVRGCWQSMLLIRKAPRPLLWDQLPLPRSSPSSPLLCIERVNGEEGAHGESGEAKEDGVG